MSQPSLCFFFFSLLLPSEALFLVYFEHFANIERGRAYENETERDLRPIELQKAKVAKQVALHRKHLAVLQASIQQIEAELNLEHEFLDINSGAD